MRLFLIIIFFILSLSLQRQYFRLHNRHLVRFNHRSHLKMHKKLHSHPSHQDIIQNQEKNNKLFKPIIDELELQEADFNAKNRKQVNIKHNQYHKIRKFQQEQDESQTDDEAENKEKRVNSYYKINFYNQNQGPYQPEFPIGESDGEGHISTSYFPLTSCSQALGIEGSYIVNECDVGIREPGYLVMSMHTINLFEDKDDLNSLMTSINWVNLDFPVQPYLNTDKCLRLFSARENKLIPFCLNSYDEMVQLEDSMLLFVRCRRGEPIIPCEDIEVDIKHPKKMPCENVDHHEPETGFEDDTDD